MKFPCVGWMWLLCCGIFLGAASQGPAQSAATRPPGRIYAARVIGRVEETVNGTVTPLQDKAEVSQLATVTTGRASSVTLIFSNGATVQLGSDTSLIIEQFLADPGPADASAVVANSADEPTISNTRLRIVHGEIVGQVKHLKYGAGSTFRVETPVGAAGIRGTTFRVTFQILGNGFALFSVGVVEGDIGFFHGTVPAPLDVPAGRLLSVNVSVQVNLQTGAATVTAPPVFQTPVSLPPATQAAIIQSAVDSAAAAATVATTTIPTTTPATPTAAPTAVPTVMPTTVPATPTTVPTTTTTTTNPIVPPPPPAPDPRTTPGDGLR